MKKPQNIKAKQRIRCNSPKTKCIDSCTWTRIFHFFRFVFLVSSTCVDYRIISPVYGYVHHLAKVCLFCTVIKIQYLQYNRQ